MMGHELLQAARMLLSAHITKNYATRYSYVVYPGTQICVIVAGVKSVFSSSASTEVTPAICCMDNFYMLP